MDNSKINHLAKTMISKFNLPSLGIGIYHANDRYSQVYGAAEQNSLYPLASISKTFLATAICQLADQGKINLDDPLKKYWTDFKLIDKQAENHLTFRDALSHQSGLPAHDLMRFTNMNKNDLSLKEKAEHVGYLEPNHELRYKMQYSNLIYAVTTYAMEQAIGQDYGAYERENLLKPLRLNNTFINHHEAPQARIVKPFIRDNNLTQEVPFIAPGKVGGASSMLATIADLLTWAEFQLKTQKTTSTEITAQRYLPQSIMAPSRNYGGANFAAYGLGMMMEDYRGHKYFYHSGSYIGYCSFLGFVPDFDLAFVFTTNLDSTDAIFALAYQTIDEVMGINDTDWADKVSKIMANKVTTHESHLAKLKGNASHRFNTIQAYCGDYYHPGYGLLTVSDDNGYLVVKIGKWNYPVIVNDHAEMFVEERLYQHGLLPIQFKANKILLMTEPALNKPTIFKKQI